MYIYIYIYISGARISINIPHYNITILIHFISEPFSKNNQPRLIYSNWSHRLRWNDDGDDDDDDDDDDDEDDDDDPWWWNLWWYWWWFWESRFQTLRFSSLSMWIIENGKSPFGILGEFPAKTL